MISIGSDITLKSPWINASGFMGFRPAKNWNWAETPGAFLTNAISLRPRSPAETRQVISYPGGFLFHNGLPNPGLRAVLNAHSENWRRAGIPIWVHLLGNNPDEINRMVRMVEGCALVSVVVMDLPPLLAGRQSQEWIRAALGELPLVLQIPINRVEEVWLTELPEIGVSAISLGAPRGVLPGVDGRLIAGRLYGFSLLPLTFLALHSALRLGLPVIGGGGVYSLVEGENLLAQGAAAVMLDSVLWGLQYGSAILE